MSCWCIVCVPVYGVCPSCLLSVAWLQIMGTLVCFFGLSAGVLSLVFKGLCHRSVVSLMGVLASVLPLLALCSSVCMTVTPRSSDTFHHSKADPLHASYFKRRTRLALVLVSTVIVVIAVDDLGDAISPSFPPSFWFCVAVIVLLGSYVLLPCGTPQLMFRGHQRSQSLTASASLLKVGIDEPERGSPPASVRSSSSLSIAPPTRLEVHSPTLLQCFRKLEYWLLFAAFFVCIGASISSLDNLDRIVDSKSVPDADNAQVKVVATSLFSLFNTGGRLLAGFLSDRCVMYVSRPAFLLAACTVMFVSQIWLAFASVDMVRPTKLAPSLNQPICSRFVGGCGRICVAMCCHAVVRCVLPPRPGARWPFLYGPDVGMVSACMH